MARTPGSFVRSDRPEWWDEQIVRVPACFDARGWATYLDGVAAEARINATLRKHLERGGSPNHCIGCGPTHRAAMHAAGRCNHVTGAK